MPDRNSVLSDSQIPVNRTKVEKKFDRDIANGNFLKCVVCGHKYVNYDLVKLLFQTNLNVSYYTSKEGKGILGQKVSQSPLCFLRRRGLQEDAPAEIDRKQEAQAGGDEEKRNRSSKDLEKKQLFRQRMRRKEKGKG